MAPYTPSIYSPCTTSGSSWIMMTADCTTSNSPYVEKVYDGIATATSIYINSTAGTCTYDDDQTWPIYGQSIISKAYKNITSNYLYAKNSWCECDWPAVRPLPPVPLSERFRQILQSRQGPALVLSRTPLKAIVEEREMRARATLRRMLGDEKFQRFLRNGFVSVRGNSGRVYQIYPGHGMTIVYDRGTPIEKLCVVLRGDFTPTDSLIARYVMILHDEDHFRGLANVWKASPKLTRLQPTIDNRQLPQIFQALKAAA